MSRRRAMDVKKKLWVKPKLVVLGRSRPEENVLANCKTSATGDITGSNGDALPCGGVSCPTIASS
jgi:hypothetical protein